MAKKPYRKIRNSEDIRDIVQSAFKPLGWAGEILDNEKKLRIRIFDPKGSPILEAPEMMLDRVRHDDDELRKRISLVRDVLRKNLYRLDPWTLK